MSYLTGSERSISRRSVDEKVQTKSRESSHGEFVPERRPMNSDIGLLVQQLKEGPLRMIDAVVSELQHRREAILQESVRMQREMIAYAKLNQTTMASTQIMSESLANLAQQDAPAMNELAEVVVAEEQTP